MSEAPGRATCLDTSVWVKVWLPEDGSEAAHDLVAGLLERDWVLLAPPTLAYEVASVLRGKARRGILSEEAALAAWAAFQQVPVRVESAANLPERAWALARRLALPTCYDAAFLAAAGRHPFVTADRVLQEACRAAPDLRVVDLAQARETLF